MNKVIKQIVMALLSLLGTGFYANAQSCHLNAPVYNISFNEQGGTEDITISFDPEGSPCWDHPLTFEHTSDWFTMDHHALHTIRIVCQPNTGLGRSELIGVKHNGQSVGGFYISQSSCAQSWYPDSDGDGYGDPYGDVIVSCTSPFAGAVNNKSDLCPEVSGTDQGCPPGMDLPEDRNTVTTRGYDIDGTLKGKARTYYNALGKLEQSQVWNLKTNKIWASETLYDDLGRPALSTLSAPITSGSTFQYKTGFVKKENGTTDYTSSDFETDPEYPAKVGNPANTLGWYYSSANTAENYQDVTEYPFSRTVYSTLNPGTVLRNLGGNKIDSDGDGTVDAWPQAYVFSMPASQELAQSAAFGSTVYNGYKIVKTVSRDVHGVENVVFTDTDGKVWASARSGGPTPRTMTLAIGEQGYVDIHVPSGGTMGFTVNTGGHAITTYNLITETTVSPSTALPNGFYRVSVNNPGSYTSGSATVTYKENYYDYALNEYDKAGRLTTSYQPLGSTKASKPKTSYEYNTLGQLVHTDSPDEGEAWFKYRKDGQIRYSQNSEQADHSDQLVEYSYTDYDSLGRPIESGVAYYNKFTTRNFIEFRNLDPDGAMDPVVWKKEQQHTTYDDADNPGLAAALGSRSGAYPSQDFVAGNVAKTSNGMGTTFYSYDVYGRVKWLVQDINGLAGAKTIDYEYHPVSGLVEKVYYQKGVTGEQWIHRYTYDVADQLVKVETSTNGTGYTTHAEYSYYETGALKRTELAGGIQGVDYVYNLAGRLKSLNHPSLSAAKDPGGDGNDLFGMQLDYHNADYQRTLANITATTYGTDRFNGNIKGIRWNNAILTSNGKEKTYAYTYDRNLWLTKADYGEYNENFDSTVPSTLTNGNTYNSGSTTTLKAGRRITLVDGFHARNGSTLTAKIVSADGFENIGPGDYDVTGITYDANGNILTLRRNKNTANNSSAMDNLAYTYKNDPQDGPNQLLRVDDAAGDVSGADDIGDQSGDNYVYDKIGRLTANNEEGISYLYNASGLVTEVQKNNVPLVKFFYNDRNHRVKKESYNTGGTLVTAQYYVRDVAGQAMAIYSNGTLAEQPIYGDGRLGVHFRQGGTDLYELTDHLGNVRATFAKTGGTLDSRSGRDYYPGGMAMPGRNIVGDYRYAFQGQEKDSETGKEAFELRLWDARIGRWLTTDPYGQFHSPYLGMGNNPINGIDPDGGWKIKLFARWARNRAIKAGLDPGELYKSGGEWGFNTSSVTSGFITDAEATATFNYTSAWKNDIPATITEASNLTKFDFWRRAEPKNNTEALAQIGVELTYGSAENVYSVFSGGRKFNGTQLVGDHRTNAGVDGFVTAATAGLGYTAKTGFKALKSSPKLFNEFARSTKGLFTGPNHAQLRSQAYRQMLKNHQNRIDAVNKEIRRIFDFWKKGSENANAVDAITEDN